MKSTESFYATIALGIAALVILAAAAISLDHAVALVAVCAAVCVAYIAQYANTLALFHMETAENAHIDDEETMLASIKASRRASRISIVLVGLAALLGADALVMLALASV